MPPPRTAVVPTSGHSHHAMAAPQPLTRALPNALQLQPGNTIRTPSPAGRYHMSRTILALALASSVSALLPAKVPVRVRGVYSAPLASSSALLSMRSRPPYMSIDPDTHAKIAAAGYSSGFSDGFSAGQNTAAMVLFSDPPATTPELQRCIDAADQIKGVDGPLLQTLATVCCTIENTTKNPIPIAIYEPKDGGPVNSSLDQPYIVTDGGVGALDAFKSSLASYGTVLDDSITDWHDELEVAIPPFAALVVQPNDKTEVRNLYPKPPTLSLNYV